MSRRPLRSSRPLLLALLISTIVAAGCDLVPDPTVAQLLGAGAHGTGSAVERDVLYGSDRGCGDVDEFCGGSQELDVHRAVTSDAAPDPTAPAPTAPGTTDGGLRPVLVWVHGGGWSSGDKAIDIPGNVLRQLDRGWDVVSVNYRMAPKVRFPVPLQDVKLAIRWVKAHAAAHGWDLHRLVVGGHSAGGNLAAMVAVTSGVADLEPAATGDLATVDSSVVAAVSMNGVLDLADAARRDPLTRLLVDRYTGCTACRTVDEASPGWWVGPGDSPVYLVQGRDDPIAPTVEAVQLCIAATLRKLACRMDLVDSGPVGGQGHDAGPALNQAALESWIDDARG